MLLTKKHLFTNSFAMKKQTLAVAILLTAAFHSPPEARAQSVGPSVLNAAGGSAVIAGNTHEFSVGEEILIPTSTSGSLVVTSGVLQPSPFIETSIADVAALQGVTVFPNPVTTDLYVAPSLGSRGTLEMQLLDATGKLIRRSATRLATGNEQQTIPMEALAASTYMLRLVWTPEGGTAKPATASYTIQKVR